MDLSAFLAAMRPNVPQGGRPSFGPIPQTLGNQGLQLPQTPQAKINDSFSDMGQPTAPQQAKQGLLSQYMNGPSGGSPGGLPQQADGAGPDGGSPGGLPQQATAAPPQPWTSDLDMRTAPQMGGAPSIQRSDYAQANPMGPGAPQDINTAAGGAAPWANGPFSGFLNALSDRGSQPNAHLIPKFVNLLSKVNR